MKIKMIAMAAMALVGVSVVAPSQAFAEKCNVKKAKWVFCSGGSELPAEVFPEGSSGVSKGFTTVNGTKIEIRCQKAELELEQCNEIWTVTAKHERVAHLTKCVIPKETIKPTAIPELVNTPPTAPEEEYVGLGAEKVYAEITIEGEGCIVSVAKAKETGSQRCTWDKTFETEQIEHEVICLPSGSKLKLGKEVAESEFTVKLHIKGKAKWSVKTN